MLKRKGKRRNDQTLRIPEKANRILNVVLIGMVLIVLRIWHLAVIQYEEKVEESRKPQRQVIIEPAKRGTIRDRFNIPLAINKIQYNAAILYSQIKDIPTISWEASKEGGRIKRYLRREYITALSRLLGNELQMDSERIEDLIHGKSALYNQIPFVLKENISETEYYRLKMLEKDWPGIHVQRIPSRYYPLGKTASDLIGYMGAINRQEYEKIIREIKSLESFIAASDAGEDPPLPEGIGSIGSGRRRLKDLQELAYSINDSIGKTGVEGRFDSTLRGFQGKRSYYSNAKGNFLKELPGSREPLPGMRILLTISSELQDYAEKLLVENESIRQPCLSKIGPVKRTISAEKHPWIKGGAIIAMDPKNGEILAMASHPRFDPNDFVSSGFSGDVRKKKGNIAKWFEDESYLADLWDMQRPLEREAYSKAAGIYQQEHLLTWETYLAMILAKKEKVRNKMLAEGTIRDAVQIQQKVEEAFSILPIKDAGQFFNFLYKEEGHQWHGNKLTNSELENLEKAFSEHFEDMVEIKKALDLYFKEIHANYDKILVVDLFRMAVCGERFSEELLKHVGEKSLSSYRETSAAMAKVYPSLKKMIREYFHETDFKEWRKSHEKSFLKHKREEEKNAHRYAKPYIDYLDAEENKQFEEFWKRYDLALLVVFLKGQIAAADLQMEEKEENLEAYFESLKRWHEEIQQGAHQNIEWAKAYSKLKEDVRNLNPSLALKFLQTFRNFRQLDRPLLGKYNSLRKDKDGVRREKHLAAAFYPKHGYGYVRSQAYRQATTQGSIFKLVTAYEALIQRYNSLEGSIKSFDLLNPLNIDDRVLRHGNQMVVGFHADGSPIFRHYKGGRMPRSLSAKIGNIDVLKALERSSNPYFALLAADVLSSPNDLARAAREFSFGSKTGIDLPGEISGNIPNDLDSNQTGVHSFSIGQHTLVVTPLQTSVMLSSLVNGGKVLKPKIIDTILGKQPLRGQELVSSPYHFRYQESLSLVGIDFSLFSFLNNDAQENQTRKMAAEVKREIFLPTEIQKILIEGMRMVVQRTYDESLRGLSRLYRKSPEAISDYIDLKPQFAGKTSTAECVENIDLEWDGGTNIYTHVWFGGVAYEKGSFKEGDAHQFMFKDFSGSPELVVVVYLRYGGYGKEAAPVAAQIAKKWKEIKQSKK